MALRWGRHAPRGTGSPVVPVRPPRAAIGGPPAVASTTKPSTRPLAFFAIILASGAEAMVGEEASPLEARGRGAAVRRRIERVEGLARRGP